MSRTLSTNSGSLESLNVCERWGCKPKAVQILRMVVCEKPVAAAIESTAVAGRPAQGRRNRRKEGRGRIGGSNGRDLALPFVKTEEGTAPGQAQEMPNETSAVRKAEA